MEEDIRDEVEKVLGEDLRFRELEEGLNTIYLVKKDTEDYILKLHTNKDEGFSEGYKDDQKARFRAEARIYKAVNSNTDVPSPDIIHTDFSEEEVDHQFYIMERMEGRNLEAVKNELEAGQLSELMYSYGQLLGEIHDNVELDGYGLVIEERGGFGYLEEGENWPSAFEKFLDNMKDIIDSRWEEPPEIELESVEKHIEELPEDPKPVLIHSDNRLENVLVEDGDITGFLDWSFTRSGHALYDLARAEYLLIDYDLELAEFSEETLEDARESLLEGYSENYGRENYGEYRDLYRYVTVLWIIAGFPNWSSDWDKERRESFRQELLDRLEKEKPV